MPKLKIVLMIAASVMIVNVRSHALQSGDLKFGLGFMPLNLNETTTSDDGKAALTSAIAYPFVAQGYVRVLDQSFLSPRIAYTAIPRKSGDGATDISLTLISFPLSIPLGETDGLEWTAGFGLLKITQQGNGGSKQLQNGTGTSTFYRPGYATESQMLTFETGIGTSITPEWSGRFEFLFTDVFSKRLAASALLSFSYSINVGQGGY